MTDLTTLSLLTRPGPLAPGDRAALTALADRIGERLAREQSRESDSLVRDLAASALADWERYHCCGAAPCVVTDDDGSIE